MRFLAIPIVLVVASAGCSSKSGGGGDDDGTTYDSVVIEPAVASVNIMLGTTATQDYQVFGMKGSDKIDITTKCQLSIDPDFGTFTGPTVTVSTRGGHAPVDALCGEQQATTVFLDVHMSGTTVDTGAPPNSGDIFTGAAAGPQGPSTPMIEYPIDQAVSPRNIPPVEVQWKAASNDLFHIALTSPHGTFDVYTTHVDTMMNVASWQAADPAAWTAITNTAAGEALTIVVEGLKQADPTTKFASAPVTVTMSVDALDQTALYYWQSSAKKIVTQTFGDTAAPVTVKDKCTACHSVSRTGSRIAYSRCTENESKCQYLGFLKYNQTTDQWDEIVNADNERWAGSYAAFAPPGNPFTSDDKAVALASLNNGTLKLLDPDTGDEVPSNIDVAQHDAAGNPTTRPVGMADWAADGNTVVYTQADAIGNGVDPTGGKIKTMTYKFENNMHKFGEPKPLVPDTVMVNGQTYNNFFFPSFSPDVDLVAFNAARTTWRNNAQGMAASPGQRMMLTDSAGTWVVDLTALNGGFVDASITWPHWAPAASADYYWLVFSSEREYGHEITKTHTNATCIGNGVLQCKQIWVSAISKDKIGQLLANPSAALDPSFAPMWLPGQDTQTDNISPYWSVPAGLE